MFKLNAPKLKLEVFKNIKMVLAALCMLTVSACGKPSSNIQPPLENTGTSPNTPSVTVATEPKISNATEGAATTNTLPQETQNQLSSSTAQAKPPTNQSKKGTTETFKTVEWIDLLPKADLEALSNPPSYVTDVEDGSLEDQISSQIQSSIAAAGDDKYQQALVSTKVVGEMDGKGIRIPGFVVPLQFDDEQTITQFFLVPFFGACIHVPPPPPNQIIFVDYPKGLKLAELYDPVWVSGHLKTSLKENDLATAAYSMKAESWEEYSEDEYDE